MKTLALIATTTLGALVGCSSEESLTEPGHRDTDRGAQSFALAGNSWTQRAAQSFAVFDASAGAAPNSAGQWIVYTFGGREETGVPAVSIGAYNVATNTWSSQQSQVRGFGSNGVAKVGSRLYLTGGH